MRQLILMLFIVLTIIQSISIYILNKNNNKKDLKFQNEIAYLESVKEVLFRKVLNTSFSTSLPFSYKNETIEDQDGKKILLSDLFDSSSKIVFRISESHCGECIAAQAPFLNILSNSIGKENILILGSFRSFKNLRIFSQSHNLNYSCYNIPANDLSYLNIETIGSPYFFIVKHKITSNVFIPEKELDSLSSKYVKSVLVNF